MVQIISPFPWHKQRSKKTAIGKQEMITKYVTSIATHTNGGRQRSLYELLNVCKV